MVSDEGSYLLTEDGVPLLTESEEGIILE